MRNHNGGLNALNDEELVRLAQSGNKEALECIILRYRSLVYSKSKSYFLAGADDDDIIQEGLIGLYNAVMKFNVDKFPFFKVFASICVKRRMLTAVREASRKKHSPLNSYVSLDNSDEDSDASFMNLIPAGDAQNPEAILIDRENINGMEYKINQTLSEFELEVLFYYLEALSYQEIAKKLNKDSKAVDNAIQRIKKKLFYLLENED